jgi:hypothetical protein
MNQLIKELSEQAGITTNIDTDHFEKDSNKWMDYYSVKFAELVVAECLNACRREWYALNNVDPVDGETPRDIGIRVGQKNGTLKCINSIATHFGINK